MEIIDLCLSPPASPSISAVQTAKIASSSKDIQVIQPSSSLIRLKSEDPRPDEPPRGTKHRSCYASSEPSTSRQDVHMSDPSLRTPLPKSSVIQDENHGNSKSHLDDGNVTIVLSRSPTPEVLSESLAIGKGKQKEKCNAMPIFVSDEQEVLPEVDQYAKVQKEDPLDVILSQVYEILPDAEPTHVRCLAQYQIRIHSNLAEAIIAVVHQLLQDSSYPKVDRKGKRKHSEVPDEGDRRGTPKAKKDFASKHRPFEGGMHYTNLAMVRDLDVQKKIVHKHHSRTSFLETFHLFQFPIFVGYFNVLAMNFTRPLILLSPKNGKPVFL
jgi:hypothetical protein